MIIALRESNRAASVLKRCRSRLKNTDEVQSLPAAGQRLRVFFNALEKMLALGLKRFALFDSRDVAIAVMIGVMKFRERVVMRGAFHPHIVNADFFQGLKVVIYDHPAGPDNRHFPDLPRFEPTALD